MNTIALPTASSIVQPHSSILYIISRCAVGLLVLGITAPPLLYHLTALERSYIDAGAVICILSALSGGVIGWQYRSGKIAVVGVIVAVGLFLGFTVFRHAQLQAAIERHQSTRLHSR